MGYTHYWYRISLIPTDTFTKIIEDWTKVFDLGEFRPILANGNGHLTPQIDSEKVIFNGIANKKDEAHETMYFPRELKEDDMRQSRDGLYFEFCKTAQKPYDIAVTTFLIIAKKHLGKHIKVSSDGTNAEWREAKILVQKALKYGMTFKMTDDEGDFI